MAASRPYQSVRRRQQAVDTRTEILRAARRLFAERGYSATPLSDIAAAARVSVPTLYASVGSKAKIALALVDFLNDESDIAENDRIQRSMTTGPDLVRANVHLVRVLYERAGDVIRAITSAATSEPELLPAVETGRRYHREGEQAIARRLADMHALRPGLQPEAAGAIATTLLLPEVFAQLVREEGWSYDQAEAWLAEALIQLLLAPPAGSYNRE